MPDGWRTVTLDALFSLANHRVGKQEAEPTVLSVTKSQGVVPAEEFFDKRIASRDLSTYKTLGIGDFVYSTIHIDEGSIARNETGRLGVVNPMYTTMTFTSSEDDPTYVALLLRQPFMLAQYRRLAAGTVNRRRSLPFSSFSRISVYLPPIRDQRKVVDLLQSVDRAETGARMVYLVFRL